jgi:hypothetical protein
VQLSGIPFRAVAPEVGQPLAHIASLAVLGDELRHAVAALALTSGAFNPQYVQLTGNIAEGEERSGHGLDPTTPLACSAWRTSYVLVNSVSRATRA